MRIKRKEAALATPPLKLDISGNSSAGTSSSQSRAKQDTPPAPFDWRKHLPVHPAAELFPIMSEAELRELGEDIKKNGLLSPIIIDGEDGRLVDGRNRLDAIELVGMAFEFVRGKHGSLKGKIVNIHSDDFEIKTPGSDAVQRIWDFEVDPYAFVLSANIHRRHLTAEQKRDLIAKVLKAKPAASNRQIAKQVKADDKTVAKVRADLESRSEIPNVGTRTDSIGRKQPGTKTTKAKATEAVTAEAVTTEEPVGAIDPTEPNKTPSKAAKATSSKDAALFDFDTYVLNLVRHISNHPPKRFENTAVKADKLVKLGEFFSALAKLKGTVSS
jgi:hypothetical protein